MKQLFGVLGALALGASAMYYFDPDQGRRRRALVGDRVDSLSHDARDYLDGRRKRTADRVRGLFARIRGRLFADTPNDQQLHGQIRSRLGRAVSYPHAIATEVQEGRVVLKGDVLAHEYNGLMAEIWAVHGVKAIDSQLAQHAEAGNVPGLQGKPHHKNRVRTRQLARNTATTLAIAGGIGAGLKAMRTEGIAHTGMLSLAIALLTLGMGDGAQRLVRHRRRQRARPTAKAPRPVEAATAHDQEGIGEGTPALLTPTRAWH